MSSSILAALSAGWWPINGGLAFSQVCFRNLSTRIQHTTGWWNIWPGIHWTTYKESTHTCSFIKKLLDATQHKVIDKIQSLCTKINMKVNVNNNAYNCQSLAQNCS